MSISELEHAIRTGSALSDLTEMAERSGVVIGVTIQPDRSYTIHLTDDRGWEWNTTGVDFTKGMGKAFKAITARRLHEGNR